MMRRVCPLMRRAKFIRLGYIDPVIDRKRNQGGVRAAGEPHMVNDKLTWRAFGRFASDFGAELFGNSL